MFRLRTYGAILLGFDRLSASSPMGSPADDIHDIQGRFRNLVEDFYLERDWSNRPCSPK